MDKGIDTIHKQTDIIHKRTDTMQHRYNAHRPTDISRSGEPDARHT